MMDVRPPFQKLPYETINFLADWLGKGVADITSPVGEVPEAGSAVVGHDPEGRPIVDRPLFIPPIGLFGVLTEVAGRPEHGPVAMFLSVAAEHHIGPNRLWVDLSRRWAQHGIRSLRLDLSGLGESPVHAQQQEERLVVRAPESFLDIEDATRAIAPADPTQVLLIGLCSAAYQALDSALGLRPAGVVAMNPVFRFVPPETRHGLPVDPRRQSRDAKQSRVQRGCEPRRFACVPVAALPTKPVTTSSLGEAGSSSRAAGCRPSSARVGGCGCASASLGRPSTWLPALVGGTDVLIVSGELESRPIRFGTSKQLLARLEQTGKFRHECVPKPGSCPPRSYRPRDGLRPGDAARAGAFRTRAGAESSCRRAARDPKRR